MKKLVLFERKREMDKKLESYIAFFCKCSKTWSEPKDWMILSAFYRNSLLVSFYKNNIKGTILDLFYRKRMKEVFVQASDLRRGSEKILRQYNK